MIHVQTRPLDYFYQPNSSVEVKQVKMRSFQFKGLHTVYNVLIWKLYLISITIRMVCEKLDLGFIIKD